MAIMNRQQAQANADMARQQQSSAQRTQANSTMAANMSSGKQNQFSPAVKQAPGVGGMAAGMRAPGVGGMMMKKGGAVKKMASGGSASGRGDGIAVRGKTKFKIM